MSHWTDPISRGVWDHPAAMPPRPQPLGANNLDTRVARLEMHQEWSTFNAARDERESRERAADLATWIKEGQEKLADHDKRIQSLERDRHVRRIAWKQARILGTSFGKFARFLAGAIIVAAIWTGHAPDADKIREIKDALSALYGTSSPR